MPYVWEDNEVFIEYRGVSVYHTYRNDNRNEPYDFHYALDTRGDTSFDVRELDRPEWIDPEDHASMICHAIDTDNIPIVWEEADSAPDVFELPEHFISLPAHLLARLIHEYDGYIQAANDNDNYQSGWRPVCVAEFYTNEFQHILSEEGYFDEAEILRDCGS